MSRILTQQRFGRPSEVLELVDHEPRGELIVQVHAAPILPMDNLRVRGLYPLAQTFGAPIGSVGVGRVLQGPADWEGRWVCLPMRSGSFGEVVGAPIEGTVLLEGEIDPVQAAGLRVNGLTAQALLDGLQARSWVVLNAANGGVGELVLQIAEKMKVNVAAVVRRPEALEGLQAKVAVVDGPDLAERLREAGMGEVHRALDGVGGEATARLASVLQPGGRVLHYGASSREAPRMGVGDTIFRGTLLQGFWLYRLDQMRGIGETRRLLNRLIELGFHQTVRKQVSLEDAPGCFGERGVVVRPQVRAVVPEA